MSGLYVHIPFCKSKCLYCDFYSLPHLSGAGTYVEALLAEWRLRRHEVPMPIATVYLGGGTPSVLTAGQLCRLVAGLPMGDEVGERTIEVNPDDVTPELVKTIVALGFNRVSMGVQSFNDQELRFVNRRHTAAQAVEAVHALQAGGVGNISIDLIYGLPLQSLESWQRSVEMAVSLGVQHISAYNLTYEEGTPLWRMRERGAVAEADDETCIAMFDLLIDKLAAAGFEHYEISNFALPGFHSRHNSSYWDGTPYLGLGAAAHSYDGTTRSANPPDIHRYIDAIAAGRVACERETLQWWERHDEDVMLRLRTSQGIDTGLLASRYGEPVAALFEKKAARFVEQGLMSRDATRYRLTRRGILLSDSMIAHLLWDR